MRDEALDAGQPGHERRRKVAGPDRFEHHRSDLLGGLVRAPATRQRLRQSDPRHRPADPRFVVERRTEQLGGEVPIALLERHHAAIVARHREHLRVADLLGHRFLGLGGAPRVLEPSQAPQDKRPRRQDVGLDAL